MRKGFLATLFAAAVSFAGTTVAFAAAPTISAIPDLQIGDMEDNIGSDNNYFVFTNAFQFSPKADDLDTTDGALLWSFAEYYDAGAPYSDLTQQFQINGKDPIYIGANAIAAGAPNYLAAKPASAGGTLTTAKQINATTDYASFRDILFSPLAGSPPFATGIGSLSTAQKDYSANVGKNVVFYVSDPEGGLAQDVIKVKTKDQAFDAVSVTFVQQLDHSTFTGWAQSGIDNGDDGGPNDVATNPDITPTTFSTGQAELQTIVSASSGRYRILGFTYPPGVAYSGAGSYVRGKFYIYTNNAAADATNKYPNFRARLQHGGAVVGVTNFQYTQTGNSGGTGGTIPYSLFDSPSIETDAGQYLKPSRTATKPSLYRVDFDPVDVPAAASLNVIPTWESFSFNDPSAATMSLTQVTIGTYPALTDAQGTQVMNYTRASTASSQGLTVSFGGFNAEGNFTSGYRQNLFNNANLAVGTEAVGNTGLQTDTGATNADYTNRFVVGIVDVLQTANASRARIAPGKFYRARFYGTSDVATTGSGTGASGTQRQSNLRFRLQTAANAVNVYQEFAGAINTANNTSSDQNTYRNSVVGGQAMPGINSLNPEVDATLVPTSPNYDGGWYTVLMPTPLDGDIRRDVNAAGVVDATTFGNLFSAPGSGSTSASAKDIKAGWDVYTNPINLTIGAATFPFADSNRGKVAVTAIRVYELDASTVTDDGGYSTNYLP